MNFKTIAPLASVFAFCSLSMLSTPASAAALVTTPTISVSFSEGCTSASASLESNFVATGITVTGPLSIETTTQCSAQWISRGNITLETDGNWFFGQDFDYFYTHAARASGNFTWDFSGSLLGTTLNLGVSSGNSLLGDGEGQGGGSGAGSATDSFVYPNGTFVAAGTYEIEQVGRLVLTADQQSQFGNPFADLQFHIPVTSLLVQATTSVPEPGSLALLGAALISLAAIRRRNRH